MNQQNHYAISLRSTEKAILHELIDPCVRKKELRLNIAARQPTDKTHEVIAPAMEPQFDTICPGATRAVVRLVCAPGAEKAGKLSDSCSGGAPNGVWLPRRQYGRVLPCLTVMQYSGGVRFFWHRAASTEPDQLGRELFSMDTNGWPEEGVFGEYYSVRVVLQTLFCGIPFGVKVEAPAEWLDEQLKTLKTVFGLFCDNRRLATYSFFNPTWEYYREVGQEEENFSDALQRIVELMSAVAILEDFSSLEMAGLPWEPTPVLSNEEMRQTDEKRLLSSPYWRVWDAETQTMQSPSIRSRQADYVAVSHVWEGVSDDCLRDELLQHSKATGNKHYWVDKWCITQDCDQEKAHMIPLMGAIYEGATVVLICHAGEFTATLPAHVTTELSATDEMKKSWQALRWHRRMWTFQEGVLGKRYETMLAGLSQPIDVEKAGLWCRSQPQAQWTRRSGRRGSNSDPIVQAYLTVEKTSNGEPPIVYEVEGPMCTITRFRGEKRRRPLALLMSEVAGRDCKFEEDTLYALWAVALEDLPLPVYGRSRRRIIESLTIVGAFGLEMLAGPNGDGKNGDRLSTRDWVPKHPRGCDPWTAPTASVYVPAIVNGTWVVMGHGTVDADLIAQKILARSSPEQAVVNGVAKESAHGKMKDAIKSSRVDTAAEPGVNYITFLWEKVEGERTTHVKWSILWNSLGQDRGKLLKIHRVGDDNVLLPESVSPEAVCRLD